MSLDPQLWNSPFGVVSLSQNPLGSERLSSVVTSFLALLGAQGMRHVFLGFPCLLPTCIMTQESTCLLWFPFFGTLGGSPLADPLHRSRTFFLPGTLATDSSSDMEPRDKDSWSFPKKAEHPLSVHSQNLDLSFRTHASAGAICTFYQGRPKPEGTPIHVKPFAVSFRGVLVWTISC